MAGRPDEWLAAHGSLDLLDEYEVDTPAAFVEELWRRGSSTNGVFAAKHQLYEPLFGHVLSVFRAWAGVGAEHPAQTWLRVFPDGRHVHLIRRDKVRQAVSWWKATQTREWFRESGNPLEVRDVDDDAYDEAAIRYYVMRAIERETATAEFFAGANIVPLTVVYEDLAADYEAEVRRVLRYLEIDGADDVPVIDPVLERLADEQSERWVARFRAAM